MRDYLKLKALHLIKCKGVRNRCTSSKKKFEHRKFRNIFAKKPSKSSALALLHYHSSFFFPLSFLLVCLSVIDLFTSPFLSFFLSFILSFLSCLSYLSFFHASCPLFSCHRHTHFQRPELWANWHPPSPMHNCVPLEPVLSIRRRRRQTSARKKFFSKDISKMNFHPKWNSAKKGRESMAKKGQQWPKKAWPFFLVFPSALTLGT